MAEKEKAETGQPTDLGQLARLVRSSDSEALTAAPDAENRAPEAILALSERLMKIDGRIHPEIEGSSYWREFAAQLLIPDGLEGRRGGFPPMPLETPAAPEPPPKVEESGTREPSARDLDLVAEEQKIADATKKR